MTVGLLTVGEDGELEAEIVPLAAASAGVTSGLPVIRSELRSLEFFVLSVSASMTHQLQELRLEPSYCTRRETAPVCVIAPEMPVTVMV